MLNGSRLPPLRGPAQHLVVLCHGYGADGNDLIGLAPHWQNLLPDVAFAAPNAPQRCDGGAGFQWFPISALEPAAMAAGVAAAAPGLDEFLDAELARHGLPPDRLLLVGFSQGTMMALHVGLRRRAAAIVGYSGLLAGSPPAANAGAPAILLVHGDADPLIPAGLMLDSALALARAGLCVQWHISPDTPHAIDASGLEMGGMFLALAARGLLAPPARPAACPL